MALNAMERAAREYIHYIPGFGEIFGISALSAERVWEYVEQYPWTFGVPIERRHLLWAFYFCKQYPANARAAAEFCHCSVGTFNEYFWLVIDVLELALPQLNLDDRSKDWEALIPCMLVDTIAMAIQEPPIPPGISTMREAKDYRRHFFCPKVGGAAFKYEIGVHVMKPLILWVNGPFKGGESDDTIARNGLCQRLAPGEMALADRIYRFNPQFVTRTCSGSVDVDRHINRHRQKVENINARIRNWKILENRWRGTKDQHKKLVFVLCRVLNIMLIESPIRMPHSSVAVQQQQ